MDTAMVGKGHSTVFAMKDPIDNVEPYKEVDESALSLSVCEADRTARNKFETPVETLLQQ